MPVTTLTNPNLPPQRQHHSLIQRPGDLPLSTTSSIPGRGNQVPWGTLDTLTLSAIRIPSNHLPHFTHQHSYKHTGTHRHCSHQLIKLVTTFIPNPLPFIPNPLPFVPSPYQFSPLAVIQRWETVFSGKPKSTIIVNLADRWNPCQSGHQSPHHLPFWDWLKRRKKASTGMEGPQ